MDNAFVLRVYSPHSIDTYVATLDALRELVRRVKQDGDAAWDWWIRLTEGKAKGTEKQPTWCAERQDGITFKVQDYFFRNGYMAEDMSRWDIWDEVTV